MKPSVLWLDEVGKEDLDKVGGKAASLGEMLKVDLPVPGGFVVTAQAYRRFIQETGIEEELFEAVDIDSDDSEALAEAESRARDLILGADVPDDMENDIKEAYSSLGDGDAFTAVRSSATAEDLPDASFAGQQDTYLNIDGGDDVLEHVRECWASLFTQRAIYYRNEQGFPHDKVDIAVVVQEMIDADKSGVMFTSHPSTGEPQMIVEAAWGLGESVVSGAVSPDKYNIDRETKEVTSATVSSKRIMHVKNAQGETVEEEVPEEKRDERVLSEDELLQLLGIGENLEDHYDQPQDVEWAIKDGETYVLQSRPITTISESGVTEDDETTEAEGEAETVIEGLGVSPGLVSGKVRIVETLDELDKVEENDILVAHQTTPDMVPAMKRAGGIVTNEGGLTSHAAIVSRELGSPAVVGTGNALEVLEDGDLITIDGEKGTVKRGRAEPTETEAEEREKTAEKPKPSSHQPVTATEVKVNVSIPEAAERAAETGADGVGLLRMEHMILNLGKTPGRYIRDNGERAYIDRIVQGVQEVADAFYPRPVRVRTLDAPSDEFRNLEGGDEEPVEHNPMLGYRGIRRSLDEPDLFNLELRAFRKLYDMGYDNVEIMLPLVHDASQVREAKSLMERSGLDLEEASWGVMVETPASALIIDDIIDEGIDFVSFGTNDLTQYTLAVDRNNENVARLYDEMHPAVLSLIEDVIEKCNANDVKSSICGQAGSKPEMVEFLIENGVTSVSANIDAVGEIRDRTARVERRLMLDEARGN
ncbi:MAG: phosphoenolpyruvate synthase [Halobacteria archaeon]|nr:phosphoenolpyruvate synthase [Halobacteria archaeon]